MLGKGWSMFSIYIFIPLYINLLGVQLYGIIGFYAILQGILIFADAGLTATLKREMSKGDDGLKHRSYKYRILRSIETVYMAIMMVLVVGLVLLSDYLATDWLNIENLDADMASNSIKIMAIALGLNFISSLYQGALLGLEKQVASNLFRFSWSVLKSGVVVLPLIFIEKSLYVFFTWQVAINLIYVLLLRYYVSKTLRKENRIEWKAGTHLKYLRNVQKYATGMFVIAVIASVNNQLDKLVLSNLLSVSDLAIYTVAYTLSMMPIVFSGPIAIAIFPRLIKFYEAPDKKRLHLIFNNAFMVVAVVTTTIGITLSLNSELFLHVWTQDMGLSKKAMLPASLLLLGQMLLSYQVIPFNLLLAAGNTKVNIKMGLYGFLLLIPTMILMGKYYGMIGAASAWLIYNAVITPIFIYIAIKTVTDFRFGKWSLRHCLRPIVSIVLGSLFFYLIKPSFIKGQVVEILYVLFSATLVFVLAFRFTFGVKGRNLVSFLRHELFS
ncbi:MAG: oligosaccharide flippase family protein [Maribacter sp.]